MTEVLIDRDVLLALVQRVTLLEELVEELMQYLDLAPYQPPREVVDVDTKGRL